MHNMHGVLLVGGAVALLLGLLNLRRGIVIAGLLHGRGRSDNGARADLPQVSILAPCRGVDSAFEAYVRALLAQDYPHYEVLFVVESTTDPAWPVLRRLLAGTAGVSASLIIAGAAERCGQKIHNLLKGLDQVDAHTTVLAFVDSDVQVHPQWLTALVTPLEAVGVGATSGYRWYVPYPGSAASSLRSAWNAATLGLMVHPRFGFAWGGSSAIRRDLFDRLRIREAWCRGLSDDLLLTRAVQQVGGSIRFVPAGLVPTFEPCTWGQLIEWTNRQVAIGRIYVPDSWAVSLLVHLVSLSLGGLGVIALISSHWLASTLLMSYWLVSGIGSIAVCRAVRHRLAWQGFMSAQRTWAQALWAPAVTILALVNLAASLMTRTITWRGVCYTMVSPHQTIVHGNVSAAATPSGAP